MAKGVWPHPTRSGHWRVALSFGKDPGTGKYRRKTFCLCPPGCKLAASHTEWPKLRANTETKAAKHRETIRVKLQEQMVASTQLPFGAVVEHWIEFGGHTRETLAGYKSLLDKWILPAIGEKPLDHITKADLAEIRHDAISAGKANQTVNNITSVLKGAFRHAAETGWIDDPPRHTIAHALPSAGKAGKGGVPDIADLKKVLERLATKDRELLLWLFIAAGVPARAGAVTGIKWSDIDEAKKTLTLQRAINRWREEVNVKNHQDRPVTLPPILWEMLADQRERQIKKVNEKAGVKIKTVEPGWFVFGSTDIGPWTPRRPSHFAQKLARHRAALKIDGERWVHGMRHLGAAVMQSSGVSDAAGMARTGHSQAATYKEVYGHVMGNDDVAAADVLSGFLDGLLKPTEAVEASD